MQVSYNLLCEFINLASRNFMTAEASQKKIEKAVDKYPSRVYIYNEIENYTHSHI
jgi:hypothetical protein